MPEKVKIPPFTTNQAALKKSVQELPPSSILYLIIFKLDHFNLDVVNGLILSNEAVKIS